jgi:hypothetical protein
VLHSLLQDPNVNIGVSVRFVVDAEMQDDIRTQAVRYILQYIVEGDTSRTDAERRSHCQTVLHEWFHVMNLDGFRATHPLTSSPDVQEILTAHTAWSHASAIMATPTVFLNGARLPDGYGWTDLPSLRHLFLETEVTAEPLDADAQMIASA